MAYFICNLSGTAVNFVSKIFFETFFYAFYSLDRRKQYEGREQITDDAA